MDAPGGAGGERVPEGVERTAFTDMPTVLMFRPTHYVKVPEDRLERWEEDMRAHVGIAARRPGGTETWSLCGDWNWCDCDVI